MNKRDAVRMLNNLVTDVNNDMIFVRSRLKDGDISNTRLHIRDAMKNLKLMLKVKSNVV